MYIKVCLPGKARTTDPVTIRFMLTSRWAPGTDDGGRKPKKSHVKLNGSPGRSRTADLVINNAMLRGIGWALGFPDLNPFLIPVLFPANPELWFLFCPRH